MKALESKKDSLRQLGSICALGFDPAWGTWAHEGYMKHIEFMQHILTAKKMLMWHRQDWGWLRPRSQWWERCTRCRLQSFQQGCSTCSCFGQSLQRTVTENNLTILTLNTKIVKCKNCKRNFCIATLWWCTDALILISLVLGFTCYKMQSTTEHRRPSFHCSLHHQIPHPLHLQVEIGWDTIHRDSKI